MSEIPESKNRTDEANEILLEYIKDCSLIDEGNLYFAATEFKSAYEQLQKQNQELIKALEFYADGLNYESVYEDGEMDLHIKIDREDVCFDEDDQYFGYAGDFARKTLAKFSKGNL